MTDSLMTIITISIILIVMFVFPLMATANQNDAITQGAVQTMVAEFVNDAAKEGKITEEKYNEFTEKLLATGNTYNVDFEIQVLDDNPGKKTTPGDTIDNIGENIYYSVFTNTIIEELEKSQNKEYSLKQGDYVLVKVTNTNVTMGTKVKNVLFKVVGKDTIAIEASASALVTTTGK